MPIIPKYERQKLASSLVGTAGVDTSSVDIANTVAQVGSTGMQVFGKKAAEKKAIQDQALANKTLVDFDVAAEKAYIDHQKNFKNDPIGKTQFLKDNFQNILQSFADPIDSPEVRGAVERAGYAKIGEKLIGETKWADQQSTKNTIDATVNANETQANEIYIAALNNNTDRVNELFRAWDASLPAARAVLGEADVKNLTKNTRMAAINAYMESNPAFLHEVLKSEGFKDVLAPDEIKKLKADALAGIKGQREKVEMEYFATHLSENTMSFNKLLNGTLTYADIQKIEDPRMAETLNEMRIKGIPVNPEEKFNNAMELYGEVNDIVKNKSSLEQVIKLQSKIMAQVQQNGVSKEAASSMLKQLAKPLANKLNTADDYFGLFNGMSEPYKRAYNGVRADAKKYKLTPSVQSNILVKFDQNLEALGIENPSAAEVDQAYDQAYRDVIRKVDPRLLKSTEVTNAVGNKATGVQPIYTGQTKVKADRTVKPVVVKPIYTEEEWAASAKKRGISVEEAKKRAGVGTTTDGE